MLEGFFVSCSVIQNLCSMTLLSKGSSNAKTAKNSTRTYILYMAPHSLNSKGKTLCSHATPGCIAACLYTSGHGRFNNVQQARIRKANYFVSDKIAFLTDLLSEIQKAHKSAVRRGEKVLFRLNGTTDIDFIYLIKKYTGVDVTELENAYFYDYTKVPERALRYKGHPKYSVTFSRAETTENQQKAVSLIEQGVNVAVVFDELPETYMGKKVIDGDQSDEMMLYNRGVVLGLRAKADAKKDTTGFVVRLSNLKQAV